MDGESKSGAGEAPSTPDAIEIAMEAERHDAAPDSPARRVLLKHERLIEAQTAQLGRQRWRDFIITALGLCVLALGGLLVWDASRASGVVVEPFAVPPDMAERGLSGHVMATQLLDKLTAMQAQTESLRAASTYANDWGEDIAVEIPNTGVSIGELRRYLRDWLGDQTRLSGEVFRLPDGRIAVTTRVGSSPGGRFEGTEAELDALLQQGAEAIYAETQPYRFTVWLNQQPRIEESRAILRQLTTGDDENDKVWAYSALATLAETFEEKERWYRAALRVRPGFPPVLTNRASVLDGQGREEDAYRMRRELLRHAATLRRELHPGRAEFVLMNARAAQAAAEGDFRQTAAIREAGIGLPANRANMILLPLNTAGAYAQARDMPSARRVMAENGLDTAEGAAELNALLQSVDVVGGALAPGLNDWVRLRDISARDLAALDLKALDYRMSDPTQEIRVSLAEAQAWLGEVQQARAAIAPTRLDCASCLRARGLVEARANNLAMADRWMARAVRLAPSLPAAHARWAEIYLLRRDPTRAIAQARLAVEKGPNWADPRKLWGDALVMQGKPAEAVRKYGEAVGMAPNWGALHLALGRAQAAAGDRAAARASYQRAARLELNASDRAAVEAALRSR
jgi:tetratricopeptide (TPR) repeat protein